MSVTTFDTRVIGAFGRQVRLRLADGRELPGRPLGRALSIVCGDTVRCRLDERHAEVHVLEVLPRRTALYRSNARGGAEPVLANLERLLVVIAPLPEPDLFVADRYLAAAESAGIEALYAACGARLAVLVGGGQLADSPGVRDFAPSTADGCPRIPGSRSTREAPVPLPVAARAQLFASHKCL